MTLPVADARLLSERFRAALLRISNGMHPDEQLTACQMSAIAAVALGCATEEEGRTYNRLRKLPIVPMRGRERREQRSEANDNSDDQSGSQVW